MDIQFMCFGYNNSMLLDVYYDHFDISIILLTTIDVMHAEKNQLVNCPTTTNLVESPWDTREFEKWNARDAENDNSKSHKLIWFHERTVELHKFDQA